MRLQIKISERELLNRCQSGDRKSQLKLYNQYAKGMFVAAKRIISDDSRAEDAMQEAFISAFSKLDQFKGEVTFGAWLKKIVINKCLDLIKSEPMVLDLEKYDTIDETEELSDNIKLEQLNRAMLKIPENYRVILNLFYLEGYNHEEIAEIMKVNYNHSRTMLNRAKNRLIAEINKE